MISALKEFLHLLFAFGHDNYSRWIPFFIPDLETLPKRVKLDFEMERFLVNTSCHRSSSLPFDHAHEQMNNKIKRVWGSHWFPRKSSNVREMDGS